MLRLRVGALATHDGQCDHQCNTEQQGAGGGPDGEHRSVVTGAGEATIGRRSACAVSVAVTPPANASGSYTLTGTGLTSGSVGAVTVSVVAADSAAADAAGGLASTGYDAPMLAIWAAAGALLLGVALMVALTVVRRQRANA